MSEVTTEIKVHDVVFDAKAHSTGKMRNEIKVRMVQPFEESFDLATDEGPFHGGDSTAPPPLALFTAGFAGCIMTQIRAFSKRLKIPIRNVEVEAYLHWQAEQAGRDPYVSKPVRFALDIILDTDASRDDQIRLIRAARQGCFIDQTLNKVNEVGCRLKAGDDWVVLSS